MAKYTITTNADTKVVIEATHYRFDQPIVTFFDAGDYPVYSTNLGGVYTIEREGAVLST